jgi:protein-S-isoprenylcysteine O-methyltransferase Ste14
VSAGRWYFAAQAIGGAAWWVAVLLSPFVREATLSRLDPLPIAIADIPLFVVASGVAAFGVRAAAIIGTGWTWLVAVALAAYATITGEAGWGVLLMAAAAGGSLIALCLILFGRVPTQWLIAGPFAFRVARSRSVRAVLAATAAQLVVFWGVFLIIGPLILVVLERRWQVGFEFPDFARPVGLIVLVLASALGIWSAAAMAVAGRGTPLPVAMPSRLVVAGPYRFVRNPMAMAGIVQGIAIGILLSSWVVIAYAVIGSVIWNLAVRPHEEADLEQRFGEDFRRYRDAVRCWIPRLRPVSAPGVTDADW